ncbi:cytidine deaminase Ccd1 [Schizosaccharomyces cryophilus OY26]|uniref:Cytidine deaminase n=1 Tax=Schizosaccharomyces cryophilus (strain OY26 / ATCC MYA-4695 / CBS 11777 / NBRC 106824 / NRRL Y48691) TaxID=653667 RepID=S9VUU4_SCHCR|nr:cytidine deaminase Ccd1 [Schizosaccharomyces cryophilus OY26]EPY51568.1 cytidine deaminase Ccd1 [Schizosaccharomyces cryophilus OY26]
MNQELIERLFEHVKLSLDFSYCPYSKFAVGACVLCEDGKTFVYGANVENASYGAGVCAERVAITKAVSMGRKRFMALGVMSDKGRVTPCGICRQVIREFSKDIDIFLFNPDGTFQTKSIAELLPDSFGPEDLE